MAEKYGKAIYQGEAVAALKQQSSFVDAVHKCVVSGFNRPDFDREDTAYHLDADFLVVAQHPVRRDVAGFLSARFVTLGDLAPDVPGVPGMEADQKVGYLFGSAVGEEFQGNGLYRDMLREFVDEAFCQDVRIIVARTQNPTVEAGLRSVLQEKIEEGYIADVAITRTKVEGAYGRMLTGSVPPAVKDASVQERYEQDLDRKKGDAFILTCVLRNP